MRFAIYATILFPILNCECLNGVFFFLLLDLFSHARIIRCPCMTKIVTVSTNIAIPRSYANIILRIHIFIHPANSFFYC